jgi:hypothetical protein
MLLCQVSEIKSKLINPAEDTITMAAKAGSGMRPIHLENNNKKINTLKPEMMAEKRVFAPLTTLMTVLEGEPDEGMQ